MTGFSAEESNNAEVGLATVAVERPADDVAVVRVDGEVDMVTAPALESQVVALLGEKLRMLVIDLTGVRFFSSAGLAVLALAHREADEGTQLRVVANDAAVLRPLELTGLTEDLFIRPDLRAAMEA
ncbi:STAS domain-containing protein [Kutzneria sp. 744]|uniref:STAS domain-containing protein n=1 Tax=Kutzneria sp. (strain 744) TaxID=345341 RepID=UPI0003EEBCAE|nr:STAS domain-containing protein [Kutzneria sp. 744]EWM10703.1 anti-anti-sigma factor [Kutzneria sp. 744]